jgi:transcriptional regulator GlxA family with amidase domain
MAKKFAFVLAHEFTLSPFAMFVDTLRLSGDEGDRSRRVFFDWQVVGDRGLPIRSSSGFELMPTAKLSAPVEYDHVVLVGGLLGTSKELGSAKERFIIDAAGKGLPITALCTASFHLARLGLLDGYSVCVSHFHLQQFMEEFPHIPAEAVSLFTVDRGRATCAGGAGAADLASHYVRELLGDGPVEKAARILQLERVRNLRDLQPEGTLFSGTTNRDVRRALLLMQSLLTENVDVTEIAQRLRMTRRQLERLFNTHMKLGPKAALQLLRVNVAKQLLRDTKLPLAEIAARVGFSSPQQLSKVFRGKTGLTPTEARANS